MSINYEKLLNNNFVKYIIIILLLCLIILCGLGIATDKHIKLFGIEFNGNNEQFKEKESKNINTKNNSHIISGNNNQVGVNGDVNYGIQQRHLDKKLLQEILNKLPNHNAKIRFWYVRENKESYIYGNEIFQTLYKLGYHNIKANGWFLPGCYDKVRLEFEKDSTLLIKICPAGNIK
ncbi:hypothetical protein [Galbibacter pacificus]|uniref:Toxin co-regulated pilus biosynthesis protein Q C-terminal domain-containing protein n=1 Tax=Galbibacter pacificus TaxID=2996052 RepID=A0ABT6FQC1_9FLAO|nr:hypothetical protein [Galbibacter pacificus]MDG3582061.1 hypothetical protein [Galbibacter pacificus]MDG3585465.1 hypothetical protein [Galbibacter pacificus]